MTDLTYGYLAPEGDGRAHVWTAVGENGAIHIAATPVTDKRFCFNDEEYYGGIETHSKKPRNEWQAANQPAHDCWLLKCPCWHDGSSTYFATRIEPLLRPYQAPFPEHIHEYMNAIMADWYRSHFAEEDAA